MLMKVIGPFVGGGFFLTPARNIEMYGDFVIILNMSSIVVMCYLKNWWVARMEENMNGGVIVLDGSPMR